MKRYNLDIKNGVLTLRTSSFKAEGGSVLHSGIYNRELASSLASGALLTLIYLVFRPAIGFIYLIAAVLLFGAGFVFFRMFIFFEASLEAVIDKQAGTIRINIKKLIPDKKAYPLNEFVAVVAGHKVITPENRDGISVVEKVALQHGTVIPGFGEVKEFYTVELEFKGGNRIMVFSSNEAVEAEELRASIAGFMKGVEATHA